MIMRIDNMKAPGDYRQTWMGGIIQVHVTRACDLACVSCTQGSNLAGKPVMITPDNFRIAVQSLKDYHGVVGIFGGNPTLHPKFADLCQILAENIPFARRGLWSNNLHGYGKLCREIFNPAVSNLNVHTDRAVYDAMKRDWPECNPIGLQDSRHSPPYVSMRDLGLTDDVIEKLINNCDINQFWSAMLCQVNGKILAYFCEIAGAQAMLSGDDTSGIEVTPNWWKFPIESYRFQVEKHCPDCGIPLKGSGDLAVTGKMEFVSKKHLPFYQLKKAAGKTLLEVTNIKQLGGKLYRATDYINNGIEKPNEHTGLYFPNYGD